MKNLFLDFIQNWIIAVCKEESEILDAQKFWASAICIVFDRALDNEENMIFPDKNLIKFCSNNLKIPFFVRVRFWHFWEAEIAENFWANWILESFKTENSLEKNLKQENFCIPIISEIKSFEDLKENQKNYLLLWNVWSWDIWFLAKTYKNFLKKSNLNIFLWWGFSSPSDIKIINQIKKPRWFFIWTSIFEIFDTEIFFTDFISEQKK
jgi:hypothetical protein